MPYTATVFMVMIASPSDVPQEREIARQVINSWNSMHSEDRKVVLMPLGWDTHSAPVMGGRAQEIINSQILKQSDLLVAIFWTRIGTATEKSISGTAEEIEKHVNAGKPAMVYFSSAAVPPEKLDRKQYESLIKFKEICRQRGLTHEFDSPQSFQSDFSRQLATLLNSHAYFKEHCPRRTTAPAGATQPLTPSDRGKTLLKRMAEAKTGKIIVTKTRILFGDNSVLQWESPRDKMLWEDAVTEIRDGGWATANLPSSTRETKVYKLTKNGYELVEALWPHMNV
jgi:hypothetical protein